MSFVRVILGILLILHGLVHIWWVAIAQRWLEFKAEFGWSGRSWLLTGLIGDAAARNLATLLLAVATAGFAVGGVALIAQQEWARPLLLAAAVVSLTVVVVFWDGSLRYIVEKGLIALLIDVAVIAWVTLLDGRLP